MNKTSIGEHTRKEWLRPWFGCANHLVLTLAKNIHFRHIYLNGLYVVKLFNLMPIYLSDYIARLLVKNGHIRREECQCLWQRQNMVPLGNHFPIARAIGYGGGFIAYLLVGGAIYICGLDTIRHVCQWDWTMCSNYGLTITCLIVNTIGRACDHSRTNIIFSFPSYYDLYI